ncbi:hypothetical protein [Nesterenkonia pannonica]|uniref:hypothetical protein n=1 Tax=Nesterenkonia pannonica TaxID=1548602 RepID=UPI0021644048|nr:hypothetical protein [Nesterenkonia pannonica]
MRGDWSRVAQWVRTQLFAIVGEGLLNAQKHGAAPDGGIAGIRLDAEAAADAWSVTIENDAAPVPDGPESFPTAPRASAWRACTSAHSRSAPVWRPDPQNPTVGC